MMRCCLKMWRELIDVVGVMRWFCVRQRCYADEELQMSRVDAVNLGAKLKALSKLLSFQSARADANATELAARAFLNQQLQLHLTSSTDYCSRYLLGRNVHSVSKQENATFYGWVS